MKPDAYMPFYGNDFFQAVKGYEECIGIRYLKALWHNWGHLGCSGLPNDDSYLQSICECHTPDWERTKSVLFGGGMGKFFVLGEDGLWHQSGQDERYDKAHKVYTSLVNTAANARASKITRTNLSPKYRTNPSDGLDPKSKSKPNLKPEPESNSNPQDVGANGSHPASSVCDEIWLVGLESNETYLGINVRNEYGKMVQWCDVHRKKPSRRRFINWLNRCEKPMNASTATSQVSCDAVSPAQLTIYSKELDRLEHNIRFLKESVSRDPFGMMTDASEIQKMKTMTSRRNELRNILGVTV